MKYTAKTFMILILIGAAAAGMASAYSAPTVQFPGNNGEIVTVHEGAENQIKESGLTVGAFEARGDAHMMQGTTFKGAVIGGLVQNGAGYNVVSFGDAPDSRVSLRVNGDTAVNARFQTDTLAHGAPGVESGPATDLREVCADITGKLILCE